MKWIKAGLRSEVHALRGTIAETVIGEFKTHHQGLAAYYCKAGSGACKPSWDRRKYDVDDADVQQCHEHRSKTQGQGFPAPVSVFIA